MRDRSRPGAQALRATVFAAVAAAAAAAVLAGCGGKKDAAATAAQGGGVASDAATVQAIQQRIKADPAMAGATVTVGTQNGTVTLEGNVKSIAQKDKAEQVVRDVQREKHQQEGVLDSLMVQESPTATEGEKGDGR